MLKSSDYQRIIAGCLIACRWQAESHYPDNVLMIELKFHDFCCRHITERSAMKSRISSDKSPGALILPRKPQSTIINSG